MSAYTRAFYAWLIQPVSPDCPKWVNATALVVALLVTYALLAWDFVSYFWETGKEGVFELNDALAAAAVRLTCTESDVEYYNHLQKQTADAKQLYENTVCCELIDCRAVSSVDFISWPVLSKTDGVLPQPTKPNRAVRRRARKA